MLASMSSPVIDQFHGDTALLHLYAALEEHPNALAAVKTASFDPDEADTLPSRAFAWESERRFPVHSREHTIASLAYRTKFASAVPADVDEKLADAMEAYDISPSLFDRERKGMPTKTASAPKEVEYAVPSQKRLPLGSAEQVKIAETVLLRDGHVLPFEERIGAFLKVAHAALEYGVPLSAESDAYAAQNACNTALLRDRIGMRASRTKVAACIEAYDALDQALIHQPPVITDRLTLLKLASSLQTLDEIGGLTSDYGKRVFDPMKTVFNEGSMKVGADMVDVAGKAVPVETLMQLPEHVWQDVDAPELAQVAASGDAAQFRQVFETLPRDIKVVLGAQLG